MKKGLLLLISIFSIVVVDAQNYSLQDKADIMGRVDSLLFNYMQKSSLLNPMSNKPKYSVEIYKGLRSLFTKNASIYDDINPDIDANVSNNPYSKNYKSNTNYFNDLSKFEQGIQIDYKKVNINYENVKLPLGWAVNSALVRVSHKLPSSFPEVSVTLIYDVKTPEAILISVEAEQFVEASVTVTV